MSSVNLPTMCTFCPQQAYWVEDDFYEPAGYAKDYDGNHVCKDCRMNEPFYVNVYEMDRCYGGAEEGGWWFDCGYPVASIPVENWENAETVRNIYRLDYPNTGKRSSVLGGEDYDVVIERHFARAFPESRPHYE